MKSERSYFPFAPRSCRSLIKPQLIVIPLAALFISACDQKDDSLAAGADKQSTKSGRNQTPSARNAEGALAARYKKVGNENPLVNVREQTRLLSRDYLDGKVTATDVAVSLLGEENDAFASRAWNEFLGKIPVEDIEIFFTALHEKGDTSVRSEILPALVARANNFDPSLADRLINSLPEGSLRMTCIQSLFLGSPSLLVRHSELLSSLTTDRDISALGIAYTDALGKLDSGALSDFISTLSESRAKTLAISSLASKLGEESVSIGDLSSKLISKNIKTAHFQESAFLKQLERSRTNDFTKVTLAEAMPAQQSALAYATATMIHRTASPSAAMDWLWQQGHENPALVSKGVHDTTVRWLNSDPIAASKWLSQQPPSAVRDIALVQLVQYLDQANESEQRAGWIQQFSDPKLIKTYSRRK